MSYPSRRIVFAVTATLVAVAADHAAAAPSNGFIFAVQVKEPGNRPTPDTLTFSPEGKFVSSDCVQYGFGPAAYEATKEGSGWKFDLTSKSAKEGKIHWTGTVGGKGIRGRMAWTKAGQKPITYTFRGKQMVKIVPLLRAELPAVKGKVMIMAQLEVEAGFAFTKHFHPGDVFGYAVAGGMTVTVDGKKQSVKKGQAFHVPYKKVHSAKAGGRSKLIVFRMHDKGQPNRVLVK